MLGLEAQAAREQLLGNLHFDAGRPAGLRPAVGAVVGVYDARLLCLRRGADERRQQP